MAANLSCIQDATVSIATNQKRDREIHYYAYTLYDQSVKIESVLFLEILADCLDERPLNNFLDGFKKDEEALYGHNNLSVPILLCVIFIASCTVFIIKIQFSDCSHLRSSLHRSYMFESHYESFF